MSRFACPPSEDDEAVLRRLFLAVDALVASGVTKSLSTFCEAAGVRDGKYRELRLRYGSAPHAEAVCRYTTADVSALACLVSRFGVSGDWLLAGKGSMFAL